MSDIKDKIEAVKNTVEKATAVKVVDLDDDDLVRLENVMLKESSEAMRHEMSEALINVAKEKLFEYIARKYRIDTKANAFNIENSKLIISPK